MMPHILSNQLLSLQPGSPKLAMTARMEYDLDGRIRRYGFEDTVFESLQRYDHDGVGADYADPDAEHHEMLHLMHEFAMVRRAHRRRE